MVTRIALLLIAALGVAAVLMAWPRPSPSARLYPEAAEIRLFVKSDGFAISPKTLDRDFDRAKGALLTAGEKTEITNVLQPDTREWETACVPTYRHMFVFYAKSGRALGALAYCMDCGQFYLLGERPDVSALMFDEARVQRIIAAHQEQARGEG